MKPVMWFGLRMRRWIHEHRMQERSH